MNTQADKMNGGTASRRSLMARLLPLAVLGLATASVAHLVESNQVEAAVQQAAHGSAIELNAQIAPLLATGGATVPLPAETKNAIGAALASTPAGRDVVTIKIWDRSGRVVHSNRSWLDGRVFPVTDNLERAFTGAIVGDMGNLHKEENETELEIGLPLLEVYAPLRQADGAPVTMVAEYYAKAVDLDRRLTELRTRIWGTAAMAFVVLSAVLAVLVRRWSRAD